jgi:rod shape-determining protein MreC
MAAVALIVAIVVAIALLVSDRRETFKTEAYGVTREVTDMVATPVSGAVAAPGRWSGQAMENVQAYFFAVSENRRLKKELKEALQWRDVAIALKDTNQRYEALMGLKTDPPIVMVDARSVTDSRGPFANTRLVNAGKERGVKPGNPVMSENGLVGRIIGVTTNASRVLLLTDIASRTPVMIDRTNARAILTGDGGPNPKLEYLRGRNPVKSGDRILTSGDGGVLPRGLPVGTAVKGLDGRWRVILASDTSPIDFVRILLFEDFSQLAAEQQKELDAMEVPAPSEATAQQLQAVLKARAAIPGATAAPAATPGSAAAPRTITTTSAAPAMRASPPRKVPTRRPAASKPAPAATPTPAPAPVAPPPPSAEVPF